MIACSGEYWRFLKVTKKGGYCYPPDLCRSNRGKLEFHAGTNKALVAGNPVFVVAVAMFTVREHIVVELEFDTGTDAKANINWLSLSELLIIKFCHRVL